MLRNLLYIHHTYWGVYSPTSRSSRVVDLRVVGVLTPPNAGVTVVCVSQILAVLCHHTVYLQDATAV